MCAVAQTRSFIDANMFRQHLCVVSVLILHS